MKDRHHRLVASTVEGNQHRPVASEALEVAPGTVLGSSLFKIHVTLRLGAGFSPNALVVDSSTLPGRIKSAECMEVRGIQTSALRTEIGEPGRTGEADETTPSRVGRWYVKLFQPRTSPLPPEPSQTWQYVTVRLANSGDHAASRVIRLSLSIEAQRVWQPRVERFQLRFGFPSQSGVPPLVEEKTVQLVPSGFAIPTAGALGGLVGQFIKATLFENRVFWPIIPWEALLFWVQILAAGLLGLVVSMLVRRRPTANWIVAVEDAWGGFIVGVVGAIYFEKLGELFGVSM